MAKRYDWPTCTMPDCGHSRSWKTETGALNASRIYGGAWVQADGSAACDCHETNLATFPCDQSLADRDWEDAPGTRDHALVDPE